jgi:hypothetical protein
MVKKYQTLLADKLKSVVKIATKVVMELYFGIDKGN